jgi:hypothetical protein
MLAGWLAAWVVLLADWLSLLTGKWQGFLVGFSADFLDLRMGLLSG